MEQLLGEYERLRRDVSAARERMRAVTGTAATTDDLIRVRVDANGRLTALEIDAKAYRRYEPERLATEILRLNRAAVAEAGERTGAIMAPFLPSGVSYQDIASGEVELSELTPDRPLTDETFDEWRARFSGHPEVYADPAAGEAPAAADASPGAHGSGGRWP